MKFISSTIFFLFLSIGLFAQNGSSNFKVTVNPSLQADKDQPEPTANPNAKWTPVEMQSHAEFQIQSYTKKANTLFEQGKYREAYKTFSKLQKAAPSEDNQLKMVECLKAMETLAPE